MARSMKILGTLLLFLLIYAFSQIMSLQLIVWISGFEVGHIMANSFLFMLSYLSAMSLSLALVSLWSKISGDKTAKIECSKLGFSPTYILMGVIMLLMLAIVLFAGVRERLESSDIPKSLQGMPIALISASLLAIAFLGFAGMSF